LFGKRKRELKCYKLEIDMVIGRVSYRRVVPNACVGGEESSTVTVRTRVAEKLKWSNER